MLVDGHVQTQADVVTSPFHMCNIWYVGGHSKKRLIFGGSDECIVAYILIDFLTLLINLVIERLNYLLID